MDSYKIVPSLVADGHRKETEVAEALLDKSEKSIWMCAVVNTFQNHAIKFVFLTGSCSVGTALVVNCRSLIF